MGKLFEVIQALVSKEHYVIGLHASERLEERGIMEWQVISGMEECELLKEKLDAEPNPTVEVLVTLPDGTEIKAVCHNINNASGFVGNCY